MHELVGALRSYAWGSRTSLAKLCGRPVPSAHPEAELWFGAHPADPAQVRIGNGSTTSLLELVSADPDRELGPVAPEFGGRLPFLLKILAAEEPLSLQAHPSSAQAQAGFHRENQAGVPLDSPMRNYRDENHKPELVVALDRFEALAGFREPKRTVELLRALDVEALTPYADLLAAQPDSAGLRTLFTTWITLPQNVLATLLPQVLDGCVRYLSSRKRKFAAEARTALELAENYPGDAGVLAALLLNRLTLEPGQALFLDAGNLHAYLRGLGVEIMANSDNVLRGGLTPKHVDVPELLRVLDFEPIDLPVVLPEPAGDGSVRYRTPAPEFALRRFDLTAGSALVPLTEAGPGIVLCTAGSVRLFQGESELVLERGAAAWISAADSDVRAQALDGPAQVFCACVGGTA
ncbi:mannose-6-phosphate isomerase, class I [Nocardia cyriacigeorgica]|uniref:mannose-6-phosphate isomerase n=2 Tax=Nocardia cyriacigeorgica TaxID=135487 RepID=H6RBR7_NOCCG|nr:mannose-6-phosphate isomerase, class I [Nocardia cyriacigeorgica]MBF6081557.1 mannose-6-phosphate isomerase, class I [Nocardia cyriacigeorgica]MBF6289445.1 mannose-6-phosphate isomerase, class I [Nocardia cyriacigeorgica]MBF6424375.1 mannose-6-phosphate isomerase, class I [Nocardia cyriacigeorgica]NEW31558.1 mannose-6-phosphate isomerase, class I [Nocardia cyriacigeorgica]CCF65109.1 putative mannose-6-phosphate isomerase [Nocardia cyriacigeorgica GUH-2]